MSETNGGRATGRPFPTRFLARSAVALIALLAAPLPGRAQDLISDSLGLRYLQTQEWAKAAEVYRALTERTPENGTAWYRLGMALQEGGDPAAAIAPLERAVDLRFQVPYAYVRIARAHAALGRHDAALAALETAIRERLDAPDLLDHTDLAAVTADERFARVRDAARTLSDPCGNIDGYRALDFWIGEWDVYDQGGQKIGENRIEPALRSCALQENWTDARGRSGKSMNFFNRQKGVWRQIWITDQGNVMDYEVGRLVNGSMVYEGTAVTAVGDTVRRRMIFTPVSPDTVRQEMFDSTDAGEAWSSVWLGIYVRRRQP